MISKLVIAGGLANALYVAAHFTLRMPRLDGHMHLALCNFWNEALKEGDEVLFRDHKGGYHKGQVERLPGSFYEDMPFFWRGVGEGRVRLADGQEIQLGQVISRRWVRLL